MIFRCLDSYSTQMGLGSHLKDLSDPGYKIDSRTRAHEEVNTILRIDVTRVAASRTAVTIDMAGFTIPTS
jgi:hypothetical protein